MVNITCPECGKTDFERDLEDNQVYRCRNCNEEVRVLGNESGFLTKDQRGTLQS